MTTDALAHLNDRFDGALAVENRPAAPPCATLPAEMAPDLHRALRHDVARPFTLLADLWATDERAAGGGFALHSHLVSPERAEEVVIRVPLDAALQSARSVADIYPNAAWYETEAFDMFGVRFDAPERHRRILTPPTWQGHALRKDHYSRATDRPPYTLPQERFEHEEAALEADAERLGLPTTRDGARLMLLNFGPHHPAAHGVFRVVLALDGEEIVAAAPDIGYHHRGVEKIAERQTWHGFLPYTDRVDYLGGVINELPYLMAVEALAGIEITERCRYCRVMLSELFRIMSHLLFYGTMAQDAGAISPVFYMFHDRERIYDAIEAITGARMHPSWFRIGGQAEDLPEGWERLIDDVLDWMPRRIDDYDGLVLDNEVFRIRTTGIAAFDAATALDWGVTGPMLRATGHAFDWRKARPYLGFDEFDFDVPTGQNGDCYDRTRVRVEEMRQSLAIIAQCRRRMPGGPVKACHPLTTPPPKARTLRDIETLVHHFMQTGWGPDLPAGTATGTVEGARGLLQYTLTSEGGPTSARTRIRTPSFTHLQMIPAVAPGLSIGDFVMYLGSIDFVMSDVDR